MIDFVTDNPVLLICSFGLCFPGIIPMLVAYLIGRRGLPFRWVGWDSRGEL